MRSGARRVRGPNGNPRRALGHGRLHLSAPRAGRRIALATGFAVLFVGTGSNFTFGVLFRPILDELGGDRSTLALAATLSLLVNAVSLPTLGTLVDRFGPRRVILAAMALMTVGTALASRVSS